MNNSEETPFFGDWSLEGFSYYLSYQDLHSFLICCVIYIIAAFLTYIIDVIIKLHPRELDRGVISGKRILFVTAHPDDECMFFGPCIISVTKTDPAKVHLLCLSSGNYRNEGLIRSQELLASCLRLGIPSSNVLIMNSSFFPDDPKVVWERGRLARVILTQIEALDVDRIITFDEDGVSGHKNHIALYKAVLSLTSTKKLPTGCRAFALDSVNIFRKYSSLFDSLLAALFDENLFIISLRMRHCVANAMAAHHSQLVWFRRLYIIFSRYMFINGFTEIGDEFNFDLE